MEGFQKLMDSLISIRDWTFIVYSAKEKLKEVGGNVEEAQELLRKQYTFLDELDLKRAMEQAQEEIGDE